MKMDDVEGPSQKFALTSLYVGDLHPEVTESALFEKFSSVGPVLSIRVCRDKITRRSLGYAYVNFQQPNDAEQALDTMNYDSVQGRPIRMMWSQRDPSLRKSGVGNVFIKNLEKTIDNKAIYDTFSAFGRILSCKVAQDETGVSKGYGFIHFEQEDGAVKSIESVNGMLLQGKKVFVGKFIPRKVREQNEPKIKQFTNLYVKNFGEDVTDEALWEVFEKFGTITSHKVMRAEDGTSRGFGFVAFKEPEEARNAIEKLNGKELPQGKVLYVGAAQSKAERQKELKKIISLTDPFKGLNVFVKNLDVSVDDNRLRLEFQIFGVITSAKVMMERGRSKGFGFVCFSTTDEASRAIKEMNGKLIVGKALYVALAQRKEERLEFLATQPVYQNRKASTVSTRIQDYGLSAAAPQYPAWNGADMSNPCQLPRYAGANMWWGPASGVIRYPPQVRYAMAAGGGGNAFMEGRALRSKNHF